MAIKKAERRLNVGILGCGPIAQFAHFESAVKGRNTELHAICDVAADLVQRMGDTYQPHKRYADYADDAGRPRTGRGDHRHVGCLPCACLDHGTESGQACAV